MIMKKALFTVLLLSSALSASAQAKYSVRVGVGLTDYDNGNTVPSYMINFNSNIRMKEGSMWIFSPGISFDFNDIGGDDSWSVYAPLQVGYTSILTSKFTFIPKLGISTGYWVGRCERDFILGPNFELGFEISHFTFGVDGFYSLTKAKDKTLYNPMSFHLNIGYVF